jgi:tetratricopeptide (TPR) repeat protein
MTRVTHRQATTCGRPGEILSATVVRLSLWAFLTFIFPIAARSEPGENLPALNQTVTVPSSNNLPSLSLSSTISKLPTDGSSPADSTEHLKSQLELARHYRHIRQPLEAERALADVISETCPESIQQQALIELAMAAKEAGELPRAQQVYAQYLSRWPNDLLVPEILLRQGKLFREMGLHNLAFAKFYAVMTSSLVLKNDKLDYYQNLVLAAQTEIADTHFQIGKYAEAADFFSRLLKQANPTLNRSSTQYRLVRALSALERNDETIVQGTDFLTHYPDAPEQPEVRFHVALALKRLGRSGESLQQVLSLLREEKERTKDHPELWAYWQQQAGNEIGNQLYRDGDYVRALSVYLALAQLDPHPTWQLPVGYQIGLTYERLAQPEKALQSYQQILKLEPELGTNASPGTKAVLEMAHWRADFVQWQAKAETTAKRPPAEPSPPTKHEPTAPSSP